MPDRCLKSDEVPVRIRDEELLDASLSAVIDAVPRRFRLHEKGVVRFAQGAKNRLQPRDTDLKVQSSAQRGFQRCGDPVPTDAVLLDHDVSGPESDICEALIGSLIRNLEPADSTPEPDAPRRVCHEQLGYQGGVNGRVTHPGIIAQGAGSCDRTNEHTWYGLTIYRGSNSRRIACADLQRIAWGM